MKKRLSLLVIPLLIVSLLTGCSEASMTEANGVSTEQPAVSATADTVTAGPTDSAGPTEVSLPLVEETETFTMLYPFFPLLATYMESLEDNSVIKYMESITNIHLEIEDASLFTFADTLNLYINSGELPDIVYNFPRYYSLGLEHAISEDIIVDLAEYAEYLPDYYYQIEKTGMARDLFTDSGYLPAAYYISEELVVSYGLIARQDWLDELGIAAPETLDDFYDMLVRMKNEYDAQMWLGCYGGNVESAVASAYGVSAYTGASNSAESYFNQRDGEVYFSPIEDGFKEYIATMHQWYEEGLIYSDFMTGETQSPPTEVLNSTAFSVWSGDKSIVGNLAMYGDANAVETGLASPVQNSGDTLHIGSANERYDGTGMSVSTNCENVELLCEWLNYWYTEDGSMVTSWGLEGESYELDDSGEPYFTDYVMNNPDGIDSTTMFSMTCLAGAPGVKSLDAQLEMMTEAQQTATEVWGSNCDYAYMLPGGVSMSTEEIETYNSLYGDIKTYVNEMVLSFITGGIDYETEWDNYIETIMDMDIETCISVKQAALDRYMERGAA